MSPGDENGTSKALIAPVKPTAKMIEDHNVSHIPFRSWCAACVRGRAKSVGQRRAPNHDEDSLPVIAIDYGFLGCQGEMPTEGVGSATLPILVVHDRWSRSIWGHLVPAKGAQMPYPTRRLLRDIEYLGHYRRC